MTTSDIRKLADMIDTGMTVAERIEWADKLRAFADTTEEAVSKIEPPEDPRDIMQRLWLTARIGSRLQGEW